MKNPVGLLAGGGEFPYFLLSELKARGRDVVIVGFKRDTGSRLLRMGKRSLLAEATDAGRIIAFLKECGVTEAVMAGSVKHAHATVYNRGKTDSLAARLLASLKDKRSMALLKAAEWQLNRAGIRLVGVLEYLRPLMPTRGVLTKKQPDAPQWNDIRFGIQMARGIAGMDIGQTVAVKNGIVIAVEGVEGTDATIIRAGKVGGPGCVVVKVARPRQDFRFDVPVMGLKTILSLKRARAAVFAIEAGKTLLFNREKAVQLADRAGLALVAV
jgi:DUF1009 family protein